MLPRDGCSNCREQISAPARTRATGVPQVGVADYFERRPLNDWKDVSGMATAYSIETPNVYILTLARADDPAGRGFDATRYASFQFAAPAGRNSLLSILCFSSRSCSAGRLMPSSVAARLMFPRVRISASTTTCRSTRL